MLVPVGIWNFQGDEPRELFGVDGAAEPFTEMDTEATLPEKVPVRNPLFRVPLLEQLVMLIVLLELFAAFEAALIAALPSKRDRSPEFDFPDEPFSKDCHNGFVQQPMKEKVKIRPSEIYLNLARNTAHPLVTTI